MNPLYQQLMGQTQPSIPQQVSGIKFANPLQKMQYILQAMQNPAAFVRNAIPDLPNEIANNPNQILTYLQQTRGITNEQIQNAASQIPSGMR
jgi:hypothetical protein